MRDDDNQRPAKRPRLEKPPEAYYPAPKSTPRDAPCPRPPPITTKVSTAKRVKQMEYGFDYDPSREEIENGLLGFCCAVCRCPYDKEDYMPQGDDGQIHRFIQSSHGSLYHRCCCHGITKLEGINDWATLYEAAEEKIGLEETENTDFRWVTFRELYESYMTAKKQESAFYNDDGEAHPLDRLMTHADYMDRVVKPYQDLINKLQDGNEPNHPVVVLDAFAGVGTGIVVLKRLGIDIAKVIHVEHDKVATHVYRWNHDPTYNSQLPEDGISHTFIEKWEELEQEETLSKLFEEGQKIDIILGGPPCVDYSKVNAYRQGADGEQGQYMLRFGRLIRLIEHYQHPHPVFFLAENVCVSGDDLQQIREAFELDWDPIALDALYFSPTRRNRHFFTNIPCPDINFTTEISMKGPSSCLEEDFFVPAHFVDPKVSAKAQCLMASKSRINEFHTLRMFVFKECDDKHKKLRKVSDKKKKPRKYYGRPMTIIEREKLMGYPVGYIENPVQELFSSLMQNALSRKLQTQLPPWKVSLPERYHTFAGNYHALSCTNVHRFEVTMDPPFVFLKLAPPDSSNDPTFFNAEDYAKHLIGMAYSVPVAEILLKPLQKIFKMKIYDQFQYSYAWEEDLVNEKNLKDSE